MGLKEEYNFSLLVNEAEKMIIQELEEQLKEEENQGLCRCQDCVLDIVALALNHVPAAYRSSFTGVIYMQKLEDKEHREKFRHAVKKAIEQIKKNPSHD